MSLNLQLRMPTIEFQGDDGPAIEYIRKRGYASYSSMKNVRDKEIPKFLDAKYLKFGKELHSRALEHIILEELSEPEEKMLKAMLNRLWAHPVWCKLLKQAKTEQQFHQPLWGLPVLGYIDILNVDNVADLKTTYVNKMKDFVAAMDFLQAALYLEVTGLKDFYYIGISKRAPHDLFVFNVNQYPEKLKAAREQLKKLIPHILEQLKSAA